MREEEGSVEEVEDDDDEAGSKVRASTELKTTTTTSFSCVTEPLSESGWDDGIITVFEPPNYQPQ